MIKFIRLDSNNVVRNVLQANSEAILHDIDDYISVPPDLDVKVDDIFHSIDNIVRPDNSRQFFINEQYFRRLSALQESDWTDTVSAQQRLGAAYDAWQTYRQALRDVPQQSGFPDNIIWPTPPQ